MLEEYALRFIVLLTNNYGYIRLDDACFFARYFAQGVA